MKTQILMVGHKPPTWVEEGCQTYVKRCPANWQLTTKILSPASKSIEGQQILSQLKPKMHCVLLDVQGQAWSTETLAEQLNNWQHLGKDLTFIIGGADGVDQHVYAQAAQHWSLSKLTLPHHMARLVLVEQLYRAWTILTNHPYHRGT